MFYTLFRAPWLSPAIGWFEVFSADEHIGDLEQEVTDSVERVQGLYMAAQDGVQQINKVRDPVSLIFMLSYTCAATYVNVGCQCLEGSVGRIFR